MSKASRDKGQRGEREVCHKLSELLNLSVTRELSASRDGGCDIKIQKGEFTYIIEVKLYRKITQAIIDTWWEQAVRQAEEYGQVAKILNPIPILIYRQSHWKNWECRVPLHWVTWQLECSSKIKKRQTRYITMHIDIFTDIIQAGSDIHISSGTMGVKREK